MNKTLAEGLAFVEALERALPEEARRSLFIIPAFIHLWQLAPRLHRLGLRVGAQNMHAEDSGAHTGEISAPMLAALDVDLVELGHSERRRMFAETDRAVRTKVETALRYGLIPLVCVGEPEAGKGHGEAQAFVQAQVEACLYDLELRPGDSVWIAYEPVWAIGERGTPASPEHTQAMHAYLRSLVAERFGADRAEHTPILYGGSVGLTNAADLAAQPEIDGLFIGRAGWEAESFAAIVHAVRRIRPA